MGQAINQLTSALGIRLFPGGPYPDRGYGDQASQQWQNAMQAAYANEIGAGVPANVANAIRSGQPIPTDYNAYALTPADTAGWNAVADTTQQAYAPILNSASAQAHMRGLSPAAQAVYQARVREQLGNTLGTQRAAFGTQSAQQKSQAISAYESAAMGGANLSNTLGQQASAQTAQNNAFWQGIIGAGVGYGLRPPATKSAPSGSYGDPAMYGPPAPTASTVRSSSVPNLQTNPFLSGLSDTWGTPPGIRPYNQNLQTGGNLFEQAWYNRGRYPNNA